MDKRKLKAQLQLAMDKLHTENDWKDGKSSKTVFFSEKQGAENCLQSMSLAYFHLIKKNQADNEGTQSSHIKRAIPR